MMDQNERTPSSFGLLLLRVMGGRVSPSEGIRKFRFPVALGARRFTRIGIPAPQFTGAFVGAAEIVGGTLLLVELFTVVATAKLADLGKQGFWATMHDGRTDLCMLPGLIAIAPLGAGSLSVDGRRKNAR